MNNYIIAVKFGILAKYEKLDVLFYRSLTRANRQNSDRIRFKSISYAEEWCELYREKYINPGPYVIEKEVKAEEYICFSSLEDDLKDRINDYIVLHDREYISNCFERYILSNF